MGLDYHETLPLSNKVPLWLFRELNGLSPATLTIQSLKLAEFIELLPSGHPFGVSARRRLLGTLTILQERLCQE